MGGITTIINKVKYIGIASLTIAILSVLTLNIISSYSSSNIRTNATNTEPTTSDTSALASIDPTAISISISSHSATGDSNDGNLSLTIPQGGGLVAGRHTVSVNVGSEIAKYSVYLNGGDNQNNTDLVNHLADSLPNTGSLATSISSLSWSGDFSIPQGMLMYDNAWGVALPDVYPNLYNNKAAYESLITNPANSSDGPMYTFSGMPPLSDGQSGDGGNRIVTNETTATSVDVYYGIKVDNPSTMLAGDYTTNVIYTVVAELKVSSIDSVSPNPINTGTSNQITLTGTNLDIVSKVTIDDRGTIRDCTSLTHSGSTELTCTLPAISNAGSYIITAKTAGGQTATATIQVKLPAPTITSVTTEDGGTEIATGTATDLVISGNNLATTSQVYLDFNNYGEMDSGEECTIQYVANNKVTCTAPNRSSAGGPYTVRLTTDGGSSSKANAVSYVVPVPTVTSVTPATLTNSDKGSDVAVRISGSGLGAVAVIRLYGWIDSWTGRGYQTCTISSVTDTQIVCMIRNNQFRYSSWDNMSVGAYFYDVNGSQLLYVEQLMRITDAWGN